MKKRDIVNLIRFHVENDNVGFFKQSEMIANEFLEDGDQELAHYIRDIISPISTIVPQQASNPPRIGFLERIDCENEPYLIPQKLRKDLIGIVNAAKKGIYWNKYLFYGEPGTGKTQAAYQIARLLKRTLWQVNISQLIDSHLGETSKNIEQLFKDINEYPFKKTMIVLFDEIDSLALKRDDNRDLREMGRATTELFKGLDALSREVVLIATTNMHKHFDKALLRRFVAKINFDVYEVDDLIDIGLYYYKFYCDQANIIDNYNKIVEKLLSHCSALPAPGELKNIMLTSIAFSSANDPNECIQRIFDELYDEDKRTDLKWLQDNLGFSTREIEIISGISKSEVSRRLRK